MSNYKCVSVGGHVQERRMNTLNKENNLKTKNCQYRIQSENLKEDIKRVENDTSIDRKSYFYRLLDGLFKTYK